MHLLRAFFTEHESLLKSHYPGLNYSLLEREFLDNPLHDFTQDIAKKLLKGVPLAQIFNQCFFYNSYFYINENVLIPRFESELLVSEALPLVQEGDILAEVGVGSGALSLALMKELQKEVTILATDNCQKALDVAQINKHRHHFCVHGKLELILGDRLHGIDVPLNGIITNPPYIKLVADNDQVHHKVKEFEPENALYLQDEEYDLWFTDFFKDSYNKLKEGGFFIMEGHENHLVQQKSMLIECGFRDVVTIQDLSQRDRLLKGIK